MQVKSLVRLPSQDKMVPWGRGVFSTFTAVTESPGILHKELTVSGNVWPEESVNYGLFVVI